jgi:hypothetical protein
MLPKPRLLVSREVPRWPNDDRTREVKHVLTHTLHPITLRLPRVTATLAPLRQLASATTKRSLSVSGHCLVPASGHSTDAAPFTGTHDRTRRSLRGQRPVTSSDPFCLHFFAELIHFNFNFSSFANVPTPLSVHHHIYVLVFLQSFLRSQLLNSPHHSILTRIQS